MLTRIKNKLNSLRSGNAEDVFLQNLGWLGASEVFVRLTRLVTVVVLARVMDPLLFGLAALVLTVNELIRVFNRNGIGAKIVQCSNDELQAITNTAYRLNFIFCISLFIIQCATAYPLADFYSAPEIVPMLQVLSLSYLLMPFGMVQASLVQREQRLKTVALIDGSQVGIDNLITTLLALFGLGAWAIVLPKFLTSPIWVFGYRRAYHWKPSGRFLSFQLWRDVLQFGRYYLSIELLKTARLNLDNMIIGRVLGMEALGLYYFARNAGLGFSLTLINAINSALYPNLCAVKDNARELKALFIRNLKLIAIIAVPLISLQAGLASIYVPIVFGDQWLNTVPVLTLLCLSALPRPLAESASALTLATGRINLDFKWNILFTTIFIISISIAASIGLTAVAGTILLIYAVSHPIYLAYVWQRVFGKTAESILNEAQRAQTTFNQENIAHAKHTKAVTIKSMPLVSVVIPVYSVEQYIEEALTSVLAQTYLNLEIIVVDDESPDQSIERIKRRFNDPRIRIIQQKNRGLAGARNTGIRNATGEYIAFLDSDDFWQANKLEQHIQLMQSNPNCGISFCSSLFVDEQSQSIGCLQAPKKKKSYQANDIFCRNPIGNGSVPVIRKGVLEQIGFSTEDKTSNGMPYIQYFDESLKQSEDVDCWTRIALLTGAQFHYIDKPLTNYRLNNGGLSADVDQQFKTWSALLVKLEGYAPHFAKQYGHIAKAFQYRYLARRCVFQGLGKLAVKFMWSAFRTSPIALMQELPKTIETSVASLGLAIIPQRLQRKLITRIV